MNRDQGPTPMLLAAGPSRDTGPDPATSIAEVEESARLLDGLDELDTSEHVARFDAVHTALSDALSGIDRI